MQTLLRVASASKASEIAALVNRAYRPSGHDEGWTHEAALVFGERISPEQVLALFGPRSCLLILSLESRLVACVHLQHGESGVYIGMLATEPSLQTQGLGKQMLFLAEQYAVKQFNATVFRMSVLSCRPELIAFYERRGYVRTGQMQDYPASAGVGQPIVEGLQIEGLVKQVAQPRAVPA